MVAQRTVGVERTALGLDLGLGAGRGGCWSRPATAARQRAERQRAEELLRLGQVARLNTLGELAAGMAHELNQPLTAMLANTQAAAGMLNDEPPELETARDAMQQADDQARRASEVRRRGCAAPSNGPTWRRSCSRAAAGRGAQCPLPAGAGIHAAAGHARTCRRTPVAVRAEPVALEQIIHNLLINALQALEQVPAERTQLTVGCEAAQGEGALTVSDSGPGIPPSACRASSNPSSPPANTGWAWA